MKSILTSFILLLLVFSGCGSQPAPKDGYHTSTPAWVNNPNVGGKTGAIGVAGRTYDQRESTRRKLAITRALDELSLQQGVRVELSMSKRDIVKNDSASTSMDTQSSYKASAKVTAHIQETWNNPLTGELFVWMVLD